MHWKNSKVKCRPRHFMKRNIRQAEIVRYILKSSLKEEVRPKSRNVKKPQ